MVSRKRVHVHVAHNDSTGTTDDSAGTTQRIDGVQKNYRRLDISLLQKVLHNAMAGFFDAR